MRKNTQSNKTRSQRRLTTVTILVSALLTFSGGVLGSEKQTLSIEVSETTKDRDVCLKFMLLTTIHFQAASRFRVIENPANAENKIILNCDEDEINSEWWIRSPENVSSQNKPTQPRSGKVFTVKMAITPNDEPSIRLQAYELSHRMTNELPWKSEIYRIDPTNRLFTLSTGSLNMPGMSRCQPFRVGKVRISKSGKVEISKLGNIQVTKIGKFESEAAAIGLEKFPTKAEEADRFVSLAVPFHIKDKSIREAVFKCTENPGATASAENRKKENQTSTFSMAPITELVEIKGIRQVLGVYGFGLTTPDKSIRTTGVAAKYTNVVNISRYFVVEAQGIKDIVSSNYHQSLQKNTLKPEIATGGINFSLSVPFREYYVSLGAGAIFDKINMPYLSKSSLNDIETQKTADPSADTTPETATLRKSKLRPSGAIAFAGLVSGIQFNLRLAASNAEKKEYREASFDLNYRLTPTWIAGIGLSTMTFSKGEDLEPGAKLNTVGLHLGFLLSKSGGKFH